jgi:RNA ligase
MVNLSDLLDLTELDNLIAEKRITRQVHPSLPIYILNYSNRAQFLGKWTNTERVCRGLIVEDGTDKVIARGPEKFFNYGQPGSPILPMDSLTRVTTKHDGSLGIGWMYDGHFGIATRGSFLSDQAQHATALMTDQLRLDIQQASVFRSNFGGSTSVYEIVYPGNRIVLDYGDRDELIPLGLVDNQDGKIHFRPEEMYQTPVITLAEAIKMPIPSDEEGYVLDIQPFGETHHIKLKGEEYKILHGLLTNTNARRIWVQLAARDCHQFVEKIAIENEKEIEKVWATYVGHDPEDFLRVKVHEDIVDTLLTNVPDEFYDWVTKKIDAINDTVSDLIIQAIMLGGQIALIDDKRKRHEMVKNHPLCKEILLYAEDRDLTRITLKAWKFAKPEGDDTPFRVDED